MENIPIENLDGSSLAVAPGEGQRPLDMITDCDSEELSFPTIYAGVKRNCVESYTKIIISELRNFDRRACRVDKLFYNLRKMQLISMRNNYSICLRKHSASRGVTARTALNDDKIDGLIQFDEGFKILKGIRSSPSHWETEKKKVMAMIRQFDIPSFFITLSAAESRWLELIVILKKTARK